MTDLDAHDLAAYEAIRAQHWQNVWRSIVPARFHEAHVDQLDGVFRHAVNEWLGHEQPPNLVLLGDVGVGKTHAAIAAARIWHNQRHTVAFWPVVELLDALRPSGRRDDSDNDAMRQAREVDLLILDDLGTEKASDWTAERLYALVNRRWLEHKPIIATSNLPASNGRGPLVEAVGRRLYDRLAQDAVMVACAGESRRRAQR